MQDENDVLFFPHGNIQSRLKKIRKELFERLTQNKIDSEPVFCDFAVLDFNDFPFCFSSGNPCGVGDAKKIRDAFQLSGERPVLSGIKFHDGLFFMEVKHSLLDSESSGQSIEGKPAFNSFCLVKTRLTEIPENLLGYMEKMKVEEALRVFQVCLCTIRHCDCELKNVLMDYDKNEMVWTKID